MDSEEYEQLLSETDKQIDRLHALYEQWFQGIERREPHKQREMLHKRLELLRSNMPRNTALRFRCQGLLARWVTLTHHWNKVSRQIEEGTYKRDVVRARQRADQRAQRERLAARRQSEDASRAEAERAKTEGWKVDPADADLDLDRAFEQAVAPARPLPSPAAAPAGSAARSAYDDETGAAVVVPRFSGGAAIGAGSPSAPQRPMAPARPGAPAAPAAPARPAAPAAPAAPSAPVRPAPPAPPAPPAAARPAPPPPPGAPARPAPPAPPAPPAAARPAPPPPPAVPVRPAEPQPGLQPLFDRYLEAKRQNNERTDNVRLESLQSSIDKMLPDLQKKHAGKKIDFEVVVKDGRVGLKPVPK